MAKLYNWVVEVRELSNGWGKRRDSEFQFELSEFAVSVGWTISLETHITIWTPLQPPQAMNKTL